MYRYLQKNRLLQRFYEYMKGEQNGVKTIYSDYPYNKKELISTFNKINNLSHFVWKSTKEGEMFWAKHSWKLEAEYMTHDLNEFIEKSACEKQRT